MAMHQPLLSYIPSKELPAVLPTDLAVALGKCGRHGAQACRAPQLIHLGLSAPRQSGATMGQASWLIFVAAWVRLGTQMLASVLLRHLPLGQARQTRHVVTGDHGLPARYGAVNIQRYNSFDRMQRAQGLRAVARPLLVTLWHPPEQLVRLPRCRPALPQLVQWLPQTLGQRCLFP